jgi:polyphosphate kinase
VRDFGMLTCDPQIGEDLTDLFNFLTSGQAIQRTANCYRTPSAQTDPDG